MEIKGGDNSWKRLPTKCKYGHKLLTEKDFYVEDGERRCKKCASKRTRKYLIRKQLGLVTNSHYRGGNRPMTP